MAGNIRKLPSGKYQVRHMQDYKSIAKSFLTMREARDYLADVIKGTINPISSNNSVSKVPKFKDLWDLYFESDSWTSKKGTTRKRELQLLPAVLSKIGSMPLNRIEQSTIAQYKLDRSRDTFEKIDRVTKEKLKVKFSSSTIRLEMCLISSVFSYALKEYENIYKKWIPENPCLGVRKPVTKARKVRVDTTDYLKLLAYLGTREERTERFVFIMIQIALHTGMRVSEIARIKWDDLDFDCVNNEDTGMLMSFINIPETKNGDQRSVPIYKELRRVLDSFGKLREEENTKYCPNDCKYMFWSLNKAGEYVPFVNPSATLDKIKFKLGIQGMSFHWFRHEYISLQFENTNLTDIEIAYKTGHKQLQVLKGYTHLRKNKIR